MKTLPQNLAIGNKANFQAKLSGRKPQNQFETKQVKIHNNMELEIKEFDEILSAGKIQDDLIESPLCAVDHRIIGNHETLAEGQKIKEDRIRLEREAERERRRAERGAKRTIFSKKSSMSMSKY